MSEFQTTIANLQAITEALNHAEAAPEAAQQLAHWLGQKLVSTVIALVDLESSDLQYYTSQGFVPSDTLVQWMRSPDSWLSWQGWHAPRWHTVGDPIAELPRDDAGLLLPVRYAGSVRGMVWLAVQENTDELQAAVLLTGLLAARLDHLK